MFTDKTVSASWFAYSTDEKGEYSINQNQYVKDKQDFLSP